MGHTTIICRNFIHRDVRGKTFSDAEIERQNPLFATHVVIIIIIPASRFPSHEKTCIGDSIKIEVLIYIHPFTSSIMSLDARLSQPEIRDSHPFMNSRSKGSKDGWEKDITHRERRILCFDNSCQTCLENGFFASPSDLKQTLQTQAFLMLLCFGGRKEIGSETARRTPLLIHLFLLLLLLRHFLFLSGRTDICVCFTVCRFVKACRSKYIPCLPFHTMCMSRCLDSMWE